MKELSHEERRLLIKELCKRYPYGVICKLRGDGAEIDEKLQLGGLSEFVYGRIDVMPYLRAMSSMSEEEIDEMKKHIIPELYPTTQIQESLLDYLYSIHVDTNNMISRGLALLAKEGMYKQEENS